MEWQYCKKTLKNKSSLNYHQKTAKYCLKIQCKESTIYTCKDCDKNLSTKQHYTIHISGEGSRREVAK